MGTTYQLLYGKYFETRAKFEMKWSRVLYLLKTSVFENLPNKTRFNQKEK